MLQLILIFLVVPTSRFVAHSYVESSSPLNFDIAIKQLPQANSIYDGELQPVYAVTGSLTQPFIFPPITLTFKTQELSKFFSIQVGESSYSRGDFLLEPGVLLTSCFSKGLHSEEDSFEEAFCLRWLHPVGAYDSGTRKRISKVECSK
jgi:hypothetical protein